MLLHDPADFTAAPPADTGSPRPATTPSAAATATAATTATTAWCRGVREVEAESVAHLIAAGAGLDTAGYTFAYVAGWAASTRVLATARRVLDAVHAQLAPAEPGGAEQLATATDTLAARPRPASPAPPPPATPSPHRRPPPARHRRGCWPPPPRLTTSPASTRPPVRRRTSSSGSAPTCSSRAPPAATRPACRTSSAAAGSSASRSSWAAASAASPPASGPTTQRWPARSRRSRRDRRRFPGLVRHTTARHRQPRHVLARATPGAGSAARMTAIAQQLHDRTGHTAGNGSLMRTGPVALAHLGDSEAIVEAARTISCLTHADPTAGDACTLWCLAIDHAVRTGDLDIRTGLPYVDRNWARCWRRLSAASRPASGTTVWW